MSDISDAPSEASTEAARGLVADLVESRLDEFADLAAENIMTTIPAYQSGDPALRPDVTAHCRDAYRAFVALLRRGGEPLLGDFQTTADRATRRVAQGITLPDFLRAFRITQGSMWASLQAAGGHDPAIAEAAPQVVSDLMQTFEIGGVGAANAYLEAQQYALADSDRLHRDLVEDLMAGRVPVTSARVGMLGAIGLREGTPYVCLLGTWVTGTVEAEGEPLLRHASAVVRDAIKHRPSGLVALRQGQIIGLLPLPNSYAADELAAALRAAAAVLESEGHPMRLGLSTIHTRLGEVPTAHHEAVVATRSLTGGGLRHLTEIEPGQYLTLLHDRTALRLVNPDIKRFVEQDAADGSPLLDTLKLYADCDLNARAAAERMHLHVNSVYYRLDRISERSGLDMRTFTGVSQMLTAIRLLAMDPDDHR